MKLDFAGAGGEGWQENGKFREFGEGKWQFCLTVAFSRISNFANPITIDRVRPLPSTGWVELKSAGVYIFPGLPILFPASPPSEALILLPLQELTVREGKGSKGRGREKWQYDKRLTLYHRFN